MSARVAIVCLLVCALLCDEAVQVQASICSHDNSIRTTTSSTTATPLKAIDEACTVGSECMSTFCVLRKCAAADLSVCNKCDVTANCNETACPPSGFAASTCPCPADFTACAGRCLRLLEQSGTYTEAEAMCAELGAHLAVPRSGAEQQCVEEAVAGGARAWVGYSRGNPQEAFVGEDGCGGISYSNWRPGQPDNEAEDNCVLLGSAARWNDRPCSLTRRVLCQLADCNVPECGGDDG